MAFAGFQTAQIAEAVESDQPSPGFETGRADVAVVAAAHRQHRTDMLHVFHYFWYFRCSSKCK
jgi:hypothetical protein